MDGFNREDAWDITSIAVFYAVANCLVHFIDIIPNEILFSGQKVILNRLRTNALLQKHKRLTSEASVYHFSYVALEEINCITIKQHKTSSYWIEKKLVPYLLDEIGLECPGTCDNN